MRTNVNFLRKVIFDPTYEEECISSCIMNIIVKDDQVCSVHKPGGAAISDEDLLNCLEKSKERAKDISKLINKALKSLR